jgi:hypothetical protein
MTQSALRGQRTVQTSNGRRLVRGWLGRASLRTDLLQTPASASLGGLDYPPNGTFAASE